MDSISIIIPHYNSWVYLNELLDTIPEEETIEVIVVDDHSADYSLNKKEIENKYSHVKVLQNEDGIKGAGAARNVGLSHANGYWLLFADADDKFTENAFSIIDEYKDSNVDLVYFSPSSFVDGTNEVGARHKQYSDYVKNYKDEPTLYNELKIRYYYLVPWSKLIKRDTLLENNIEFKEIEVSNDIYFSASIGFYSQILKVDDRTIYEVRESENSLTSSMTERKFKLRFSAWLDYINFLQGHLKKEDLDLLGISSMPQFYIVSKNKLSFDTYLYVLKRSWKNKIPIFNLKTFNKFLSRRHQRRS